MAGTTTVQEFKGTENLVYAEVTKDDSTGIEFGAVKVLAPVAEISKTTETASATHYYDNVPAIVINSEGSDEIKLKISALSLTTLADITGKSIDATTGALLDGERKPKYFALGYKIGLTDGTSRYVWRYKGSFGIPAESSKTKDAGTDAEGQELTYTGIATTYKFTKTGSSQKAIVVDERDKKAKVTNFFDTVTTCDTIQAIGG